MSNMKRFVAFLLLFAICLTLFGCTKSDTKTDTTDTGTEPVADVTTEADTTEAVTTEPTFDWKTTALGILAEYVDTIAEYCVYDMNGDNVPEIIVRSGSSSADMSYYLYDLAKDKPEPVKFGIGSSLLCGFDENSLILQFGKMGDETVTRYTYDGEKLSEELLLSREVPLDEDYIAFKGLQYYSADDPSGLSWTENPENNNPALLDAVK